MAGLFFIKRLHRWRQYLDVPAGIAVDSSRGMLIVAGNTKSTDFPTSSCLGTTQKTAASAFAFKLNAAGTGLTWSTCLAANTTTSVNGIALGPSGNLFVVGSVKGSFPVTPGAAQTVLPAGNPPTAGFAAELGATGSAFAYATYLTGSNCSTAADATAVDAAGNLFVTGSTTCADSSGNRRGHTNQRTTPLSVLAAAMHLSPKSIRQDQLSSTPPT